MPNPYQTAHKCTIRPNCFNPMLGEDQHLNRLHIIIADLLFYAHKQAALVGENASAAVHTLLHLAGHAITINRPLIMFHSIPGVITHSQKDSHHKAIGTAIPHYNFK